MLEIVVEMAGPLEEGNLRVPRAKKLDFISDCLDAGLDVRVRTAFVPSSSETLLDLGSDLARAGVTRWRISPIPSRMGSLPNPDSDRWASEEIQQVLTAFPWINVDSEVLVERRAHGLVDPEGRKIAPGSRSHRRIITDLRYIDHALVAKLAADPRLLHSISPREFEQLVAHLLERRGYEVRLTPATRDGGKDLYVASRTDLGNFLFVVECKRYDLKRPVGVEVIRALYGVVQAERATAGILATTSFFSKEAKQFQSTIQFQMQLHDYYSLHSWIREALRR